MLLKNQKEDTTDYTKDWPARYYDIPTGALRREHLKRARSLPSPQTLTGKCSASVAFFQPIKTVPWTAFSTPGP